MILASLHAIRVGRDEARRARAASPSAEPERCSPPPSAAVVAASAVAWPPRPIPTWRLSRSAATWAQASRWRRPRSWHRAGFVEDRPEAIRAHDGRWLLPSPGAGTGVPVRGAGCRSPAGPVAPRHRGGRGITSRTRSPRVPLSPGAVKGRRFRRGGRRERASNTHGLVSRPGVCAARVVEDRRRVRQLQAIEPAQAIHVARTIRGAYVSA
jgi:hypothetical protein